MGLGELGWLQRQITTAVKCAGHAGQGGTDGTQAEHLPAARSGNPEAAALSRDNRSGRKAHRGGGRFSLGNTTEQQCRWRRCSRDRRLCFLQRQINSMGARGSSRPGGPIRSRARHEVNRGVCPFWPDVNRSRVDCVRSVRPMSYWSGEPFGKIFSQSCGTNRPAIAIDDYGGRKQATASSEEQSQADRGRKPGALPCSKTCSPCSVRL